VLFNITGGPDLTMMEVDEAAKQIAAAVDPDANIIFGATIDDSLVDQVKITVIATGFDETKRRLRELSNRPAYGAVQTIGSVGQVIRQQQFSSSQQTIDQSKKPVSQAVPPADDLPPEEDEFDIPAFLRQRS
jgi:cell division protein FtsZ